MTARAFSAEVDLKGVYARLRGLWFGDKKMRQTNESRAHSGSGLSASGSI
jgi:hypothetical protein